MVLRKPLELNSVLFTGLSPSMVSHSRLFYYRFKSHIEVLQPRLRASMEMVWTVPVSLAATYGISLIFIPHLS